MLASSTLSWALTLVFVVTGVYSLGRLASLAAGTGREGDRLAELSHLVMSVAMVAMVWGLSGGPGSPSGVVQLVVFGLFAVAFLALVLTRSDGHSRAGHGFHLLAAVAMVWMVAAMPWLMGVTGADDDAGSHAGHAGHGAAASGVSETAGTIPAPGWVVGVSVALIALLGAAAVRWLVRAVRPVAGGGAACAGSASRTADPTATSAVAVMTATRVEPAAPPTAGVRADAVCHLLMGLGMAVMLAAML